MTLWTIGLSCSGAKVGCAYAKTFAEACRKLGVNWQKCYTIRCD